MASFRKIDKDVRKTILDRMMETGKSPAREDIRDLHHLTRPELDQVFLNLEAGIVIAVQNRAHTGLTRFHGVDLPQGVPDLGEIFYVRPFASFANHFKVSVEDGRQYNGECAVEMCGVSCMFPGQKVTVASLCRETGEKVELVLKDGDILSKTPDTLTVHLGFPLRRMPEDTIGWCDYNSFFVSPGAAASWQKRHPGVRGALRTPEQMNGFVYDLVGQGRLDYDYHPTFPLAKVMKNAVKYGLAKPMPGLGIPVPDPFFLPTPAMARAMRKKGYKNFIKFSW